MKRLLAIIILLTCVAVASADDFDNRGVIKMFSGVSLPASGITTFGVQDVSDRDAELCVMVYATGDSGNVKLDILGMLSPNSADTTKAITILSSTELQGAGAVTFADTLSGDEMVPYLYFRLTNVDADSAVTVDGWLYMKQRDITILQN